MRWSLLRSENLRLTDSGLLVTTVPVSLGDFAISCFPKPGEYLVTSAARNEPLRVRLLYKKLHREAYAQERLPNDIGSIVTANCSPIGCRPKVTYTRPDPSPLVLAVLPVESKIDVTITPQR